MLPETNRIPFYSTPHTRLHTESDARHLGEPPTRYDLDDLDVAWLELVNTEYRELGKPPSQSTDTLSSPLLFVFYFLVRIQFTLYILYSVL